MKMTVECQCGNVFGRWRPRCPACGEATPYAAIQPVAQRPAAVRREKRVKDPCILCHRKKAKVACPQCGERAHKGCLVLHLPICAEFQQQRAAELAKLEGRS